VLSEMHDRSLVQPDGLRRISCAELVNLVDRVVEVSTGPDADGHATTRSLRAGDLLRPARVPGVELAVADIPGLT
jgi:hypothetical protein